MSAPPSDHVYAYSGGFLGPGRQARRIRRILALSGLPLRTGLPAKNAKVAVWGHAKHAWRGEWIAAQRGAKVLRLEDAFLRSLFPGRAGEPTLGLLIDHQGAHYDPATPSDIETLLATHPLDDHALLERARLGMARLKALQLSKYAAHDPDLRAPDPGYVLIVDQVRGDASLSHGGLNGPLSPHLFREMLVQAQLDFPGARIMIRTHPETQHGYRTGHFTPEDASAPHITFLSDPVSSWELLEGAIAVYTVSSQLGFEAIFAGHKPRVYGLPFYAGWGLSDDQIPHPRRRRTLTRAQLFAAAMLLYPKWYDPCRDRLCRFEDALDQLEALTRAWREDRNGYAALNMRLWKRPHLQAFFGRWQKLHFAKAPRANQRALVWGMAAGPARAIRIEDGFLRSRGLGAELTPPVSLVADDLGLYYDPSTPSRLEALIAAPPHRAVRRAPQPLSRVSVRKGSANITSIARSPTCQLATVSLSPVRSRMTPRSDWAQARSAPILRCLPKPAAAIRRRSYSTNPIPMSKRASDQVPFPDRTRFCMPIWSSITAIPPICSTM